MELIDRLLEGIASDEPHGVIRTSTVVSAQAVDRDDARVLEAAGNFGLQEEALAADRIVGVPVEDLFERDFAVQLDVHGDEDGPQATLGVRAEDTESLALGGGAAHRVAGGTVGIGADLGGGRAKMDEGSLNIGIGHVGQALARGSAGGEGREAPLGVARVLLQVERNHRLDAGALVGVQVAAVAEVLGQWPAPATRPCLKRRDKLGLINQAVLQGKNPKQQIVGSSHVINLPAPAAAGA